MTSGEPLLVVQSRPVGGHVKLWDGELPTFSLAYTKGMARATSFLALLHCAWKFGFNLQECHPRLHESALAIHVHHVQQASKLDEALTNMKLSSRGSIRKMANVIQMTHMIRNLMIHGLTDFSLFVKKWNQMSARSHQIIGKRAMSLKLLFECAPKVVGPN